MDFVDLSHIPVTVYEFTDAWGAEPNDAEGIPNPTIRVMFTLSQEGANVLSYGFSGGYWDGLSGLMGREFSIAADGEARYLIVVGGEIENISTQGYATGGWDTEKTVEAGVALSGDEPHYYLEVRRKALAE